MSESLDHRERRLGQLGEAIEALLDEGWVYWLILGKPGEPESTNIVSNAPPQTAVGVIETMMKVLKDRYGSGINPKNL